MKQTENNFIIYFTKIDSKEGNYIFFLSARHISLLFLHIFKMYQVVTTTETELPLCTI